MTRLVRHDSVALALLALGKLPERDALQCEEHLTGCADCCTALADKRETVAALDEAGLPPEFFHQDDPDSVFADPDPVLEGILGAVQAAKRVQRRQRFARPLAAAAAVIVLLLAGVFALARATAPPASPAAVAQVAGTQVARGTGVDGSALQATLTPHGQWVAVAVLATGFPRGQVCRLFLVTADGRRELAGSWVTPAAGEPPAGLHVQMAAAVALPQVRAVAVDTDHELVAAPVV